MLKLKIEKQLLPLFVPQGLHQCEDLSNKGYPEW